MNIFNTGIFTGDCVYNGIKFKYVFYMNPSSLSKELQTEIVNKFGDQMIPETLANVRRSPRQHTVKLIPCLGRTKKIVRIALNTNTYDAVCFVINTDNDEMASCVLQYRDLYQDPLNNMPHIQLWIYDLCRITPNKQSDISPTKVLFYIVHMLAKRHDIDSVFLAVDKRHNTHARLIKRYNETYKYNITVPSNYLGFHYTIMKRDMQEVENIDTCGIYVE